MAVWLGKPTAASVAAILQIVVEIKAGLRASEERAPRAEERAIKAKESEIKTQEVR